MNTDDNFLARVQAEQAQIKNIIEEAKRLAARSDQLLDYARAQRSLEAEGETEDA